MTRWLKVLGGMKSGYIVGGKEPTKTPANSGRRNER
jgi:hypothetical protein